MRFPNPSRACLRLAAVAASLCAFGLAGVAHAQQTPADRVAVSPAAATSTQSAAPTATVPEPESH